MVLLKSAGVQYGAGDGVGEHSGKAHWNHKGRISVLKRRHGLERCRYRGPAGTERWVGLGVIAHNLLTIATAD